MDERVRDVIKKWDRLEGDRGTWKNHWQQITELCLPERNDYTVQRTPGMKRNQAVYDSTPIFALIQFANGLHSLLTSPTLKWFSLQADDDRLNSRQRVRQWFDDVALEMYSYFNSARHNFASQSHELYLDLGSIGTGVMAVLEHPRSGILFTTRHLKECCFWENDEDRVDGLVRRWKWKADQAVQAYGSAVGPQVMKAYLDGQDKDFHFYHQVKPRKDRNPDRIDARHMAYESLVVGQEDGEIIRESGFQEFPYLAPRLSKTAGETYGRGPGMTALPDMKMLNELMKMVVKAAQKVVDPPLQIPDDGYLLPIKTVPGSQNFFRSNSPAQARITPIETHGRIDIGEEMLNGLRLQLMRTFYVEWMMMPSDPSDPAGSGKGVTATWVLQQRDDKMRFLSPMLARLNSEFVGPLIDRVYAILMRKSQAMNFGPGSPFPPPPEELSGVSFHPEYLSPLAIAQRSSQLDSVGRLIQQQLILKQLNPDAPDIIDHEGVMRLTSRDLNAPAIALKSTDALAAENQARADAQQQLQQGDALVNAAGALKDGAGAVKTLREAETMGAAQ